MSTNACNMVKISLQSKCLLSFQSTGGIELTRKCKGGARGGGCIIQNDQYFFVTYHMPA